MPTIFREGPWRFFFYSNEGTEPPHVHVARDGRVAKFWLAPVSLASSSGFAAVELARLRRIIHGRQDRFLESWHDYFGRR